MRRLLLPLVGVLLLVPALPAHAETWSGADGPADVQALHLDFAPSNGDPCAITGVNTSPRDARRDIESLAVDHGRQRVSATVHLREVTTRPGTEVTVHLRTERRTYAVRGVFLDRTTFYADLEREQVDPTAGPPGLTCDPEAPGPPATTARFCKGLRVIRDTREDTIGFSVPRRCLGDPVTVQAAAETFAAQKRRGTRMVLFRDFWSPDGAPQTDQLPPFGPPLARG